MRSPSEGELVSNLVEVLGSLHGVDLFAAADKCRLSEATANWYDKVYPGEEVEHDPKRVRGLTDMTPRISWGPDDVPTKFGFYAVESAAICRV